MTSLGVWVPCSERLPEHNDVVVVWVQNIDPAPEWDPDRAPRVLHERVTLGAWNADPDPRFAHNRGWWIDNWSEHLTGAPGEVYRVTHWCHVYGPEDIRGFER